MSPGNSALLYAGSFVISAAVHFGVKYLTTDVGSGGDVLSLVLPELQTGLITMLAVFISSQMFAQEAMAKKEEESRQDSSKQENSSQNVKEDEQKAVPAEKVDIMPSLDVKEAKSTTRKSFQFPESPSKGSETRRSFKKDKEVESLRKRVSEFDNDRRQLEKTHAKRLKERENELLVQHSEERGRLTQQHKEERDRIKREQKEEITAAKKMAIQEARGDLTKEIKEQLKVQLEKDYQDKLKKEVEQLKQKETGHAEKKKEFGSDKKKGRGGRETSTTPKGQVAIGLTKSSNDDEMNKLRAEKEQAQKNYISCLQNYENEKRQNETLKKSIASLQKSGQAPSGTPSASDPKSLNTQKAEHEREKKDLETKHQQQIDAIKKDLIAKLEEQGKLMTDQMKLLKKDNDENKQAYLTYKQRNQKEIEILKASHANEIAKLKQGHDRQIDQGKQQKASGVDKMKNLLAKEFEQRIKKQEDTIRQMNEAHAKKLAQLKQNSDKEKIEIQQKFQKEVDQQKSTTRQQLLILERKQKFVEQQKQKTLDYEIGRRVKEEMEEIAAVLPPPPEKKCATGTTSKLQSKLKIEELMQKDLKRKYEELLEEKVQEQEEKGNESARNLNELMRKRRTEYKQEKAKLEEKIKSLQAQIQTPQMLTAIQNRLKSEYDRILDEKLEEQEQKSNESARNINELMRKRKVEHKAEKQRLEQTIQKQSKQIQDLQGALKGMKETFSMKFKEAKDQSKSHQDGVTQEITDLKSQLLQITQENAKFDQVVQKKEQDLKKSKSEIEQLNQLIQQIEAQDSQLDQKLRPKSDKQSKQSKPSKGQNGVDLMPLPERIRAKFDKILESNESKVADLEYTIEQKDDELAAHQEQISQLKSQISQSKEASATEPAPPQITEAPAKPPTPKSAAGNKVVKSKPPVQPAPEPIIEATPHPLFESSFAAGEYTREKVSKLDVSLKHLVSCLKEALNGVSLIRGKDIVLCLGNTGTGKTTLLNSLIYGPESLQIVEIKEKVKIKKGKTKENIKKVIDVKPEFKDNALRIGHSTAVSETFRPDTVVCKKSGMMFVDVAGFGDSGSYLVELINMFVDKHIFNISKSISFILTMTVGDTKDARGNGVRELINILNMMCSSDLSQIKGSIIPVLTKCKPGDPDLDLDEVRANLEEMLAEEFNTISANIQDPQIKEAIGKQNQNFVDILAQNLVMYDPLDRPMPSQQDEDNQDQGTKQKELLQIIDSLELMRSEDFNAPFTRKIYSTLQTIISKEIKKIDQTINDMIAEAKKQGDKYQKKISDDANYKQLLSDLKFMRENNLLEEAADHISKLEHKELTSQKLIDNAREFEKLNQIEKQNFTIEKKLVQHLNSNSPVELAKAMVDARNFTKDLKKNIEDSKDLNELSKMELLKSNMDRKLEDIVTQLSINNMAGLLNLSYELLKLEADCKPENKFVKEMLEGNVKPAILVDIICSNSFDAQTNSMVAKAGQYFQLVINQTNNLIYKKKGLGSNSVNLSGNVKKIKDQSMKFQFTLTNCSGFLITTEESNILASENGKVEPIMPQSPVIKKHAGQGQAPIDGMIWILSPQNATVQRDELPYFHIEQPYDMVRPRLICPTENSLIISSKSSQTYKQENTAVWMVSKDGK